MTPEGRTKPIDEICGESHLKPNQWRLFCLLHFSGCTGLHCSQCFLSVERLTQWQKGVKDPLSNWEMAFPISSNAGILGTCSRIPLVKDRQQLAVLILTGNLSPLCLPLHSSGLLDTCPVKIKNSSALGCSCCVANGRDPRNAHSRCVYAMPTGSPDWNQNPVWAPVWHHASDTSWYSMRSLPEVRGCFQTLQAQH